MAVARLYGDKFGVDFWTIALHYLKLRPEVTDHNDDQLEEETENYTEPEKDKLSRTECVVPLESCYDVLCVNDTYKVSIS